MGHVGETTSPDGVGDKADPTVRTHVWIFRDHSIVLCYIYVSLIRNCRTCSQPVLTPKQFLPQFCNDF